MLNTISHRLPPYRGVVNFIWAQLYTVVNIFMICWQEADKTTVVHIEEVAELGIPRVIEMAAKAGSCPLSAQ